MGKARLHLLCLLPHVIKRINWATHLCVCAQERTLGRHRVNLRHRAPALSRIGVHFCGRVGQVAER